MKHLYPTTIEEASLLLDKIKPGWEKIIDVNTLMMDKFESCILGQLFDGYITAMRTLFVGDESLHNFYEDRVFGSGASTKKWIDEIEKRCSAKVNDFAWVIKKVNEGKKVQLPSWDDLYWYVRSTDNLLINNHNTVITPAIMNQWVNRTDWQEYEPKIMVKQGSRVKLDNDEYIVARFDSGLYGLIGLADGNRWGEGVKVDLPCNIFKLTGSAWNKNNLKVKLIKE